MADLAIALSIFSSDPVDADNQAQLVRALGVAVGQPVAADAADVAAQLTAARRALIDHEQASSALWLIDAELAAVPSSDVGRQVALWLEKAGLLDEEMYDAENAKAALRQALGLRPNDTAAKEQLGEIDLLEADRPMVEALARYVGPPSS